MELFITFLAGISILVGAIVIKLSHNTEKIEHLSIAMALAALLTLMVVDLVPDVIESADSVGWIITIVFVAAGVAILKILDLFVPDHEDNEKNHEQENTVHIGMITSLAIILHNIVEGMTVYSLSLADTRQGLIFAIGIALHNIPMGMLIESTMEKECRSKHIAVLSSVTLSTLLGGIIMQALSGHFNETITSILVSIALGMIIYIVFLELLPHVLKTKDVKLNIIGAVIGFALVFISSRIG